VNIDEFEARVAYHRDRMHQAFLRDDGSIERLEINVRIVAAALDFVAQVSTIAEGEGNDELVAQADIMGMSIAGLLVSNTSRLLAARSAFGVWG
jgi:hypothetical protein